MRKLFDRAEAISSPSTACPSPTRCAWIQKTSMDRRLTMRKVAEAVIEGSMRVPEQTPQP